MPGVPMTVHHQMDHVGGECAAFVSQLDKGRSKVTAADSTAPLHVQRITWGSGWLTSERARGSRFLSGAGGPSTRLACGFRR